jgi:hypothetical protein
MEKGSNKQVKKAGHGLRATLLILLIVLGLVSYWTKYPSSLYEKLVYGELIDTSLNSDGTVWILTDGTIKYTYTVNDVPKTGLLFCKTNLYLYDPIKKTVLKTITTNYKDLPPGDIKLVQENNRLWQSGPQTVTVYDPKTGEELQNTDSFVLNHSELSPGIARVALSNYPNIFIIETKDARKFICFIEDASIVPNEDGKLIEEKIYQHYENLKVQGVLLLVEESSSNSSRQMLYHVTGSIPELVNKVILFHPEFADLSSSDFRDEKGISAAPSSAKDIYLDPLIVYQDQDIAFVVSQNQVGEVADRVLTCVDSTGAKKWAVQQDELLEDLKLTKENRLAKIFLKSALKGDRRGNSFVLTFKHHGVMGFDVATGKKLWQLQLAD